MKKSTWYANLEIAPVYKEKATKKGKGKQRKPRLELVSPGKTVSIPLTDAVTRMDAVNDSNEEAKKLGAEVSFVGKYK